MDNTKISGQKTSKKESLYLATIIVLLIVIAVLTWQLVVNKTTVKEVTAENLDVKIKNEGLLFELDSILVEYSIVKSEYDSVLVEKDSIIMANAEEIKKLLASQADYKKIRKQLDHLRNITQSYVLQIDSLHQVNAVLKDENVRVQANFEKAKEQSKILEKDKEQLTEKVEKASTLKAYQSTAQAIRIKSGKEEITDKARRTEKIKIIFTLSENLIVTPGPKNVYARIAGPDNIILTPGKGDEYAFENNGQMIQYSVKKQINYRNKAEHIQLYWDNTSDFAPGVYNISLFIDNYEIGQTVLEIK